MYSFPKGKFEEPKLLGPKFKKHPLRLLTLTLKFHKTQSGLQELRHATRVRIFNSF
jgi:hypothetical protein